MQKMGLISGAQLVNREVKEIVINNNSVTIIGNLGGVMETSGSTVVDGDGQLDFAGGLACSSGNSTKKIGQFAVGRGVVQIAIEVLT